MNAAGKGLVKQHKQVAIITPQMQVVLDYLAEHKEMEAVGRIQIISRGKERKYVAQEISRVDGDCM